MITRKRTGACPKYLPTPLHELRVDQMCVPDLYAFIKLYGREVHVLELTSLLKLRRNRLVRLYRDVLENPQRPMISTFFGRRDFERNVDFNGINMGNEIYYPRNNNRNNNNQPPNNGPGQGNGRVQRRGGNNNVPLQGGNNNNNNQPPNNGPGQGNGRVQQGNGRAQQGNGMEVEIINPVQTGINNRQRNNMVEGNGMEVEIINPVQTGINNSQRQQRIKWRAPKIEDIISLLTKQKNGPRSSVQGTRRSSRIPPRSQSLLTYRQNGQSSSRQNGQSSSRQNGLRLPETRSQSLLTNGLQKTGTGNNNGRVKAGTGLTVQQGTRGSPRLVPVQGLLTYRQNGQSSSRQNGLRLPETPPRSQGLLTNGLQGNGSGQRTGLTVQQGTRGSPRLVPVQGLLTYRQNGQSSSRQNGQSGSRQNGLRLPETLPRGQSLLTNGLQGNGSGQRGNNNNNEYPVGIRRVVKKTGTGNNNGRVQAGTGLTVQGTRGSPRFVPVEAVRQRLLTNRQKVLLKKRRQNIQSRQTRLRLSVQGKRRSPRLVPVEAVRQGLLTNRQKVLLKKRRQKIQSRQARPRLSVQGKRRSPRIAELIREKPRPVAQQRKNKGPVETPKTTKTPKTKNHRGTVGSSSSSAQQGNVKGKRKITKDNIKEQGNVNGRRKITKNNKNEQGNVNDRRKMLVVQSPRLRLIGEKRKRKNDKMSESDVKRTRSVVQYRNNNVQGTGSVVQQRNNNVQGTGSVIAPRLLSLANKQMGMLRRSTRGLRGLQSNATGFRRSGRETQPPNFFRP